MGPEFNPRDDEQPTMEEWNEYEASRHTPPGPSTLPTTMLGQGWGELELTKEVERLREENARLRAAITEHQKFCIGFYGERQIGGEELTDPLPPALLPAAREGEKS